MSIPKLVKLDCHDPEGSAKRYERAVKMAGRVQLVSYALLSSQRWVAFVHNGYSSAVVLSHGMQSGLCTCEDFKKNQRTCKHIYATVLAINEMKSRFAKEDDERIKVKAMDILKHDLAEKAAAANGKLLEIKDELDKQLEELTFHEAKIDNVQVLEELV